MEYYKDEDDFSDDYEIGKEENGPWLRMGMTKEEKKWRGSHGNIMS